MNAPGASWGRILTTRQLCDQRRSRTSSNSTRSQRTTYGRSSPAARQRARVSSKDWYVYTFYATSPATTNDPSGMALQQRQASRRRQISLTSPVHPSLSIDTTACAHSLASCIYPVLIVLMPPFKWLLPTLLPLIITSL